MQKVTEEIETYKVVPVLKLVNLDDAKFVLSALCEGGLPCAEITFRTECCADAIALARKCFPKMLVGAGTVLTVEQVRQTVDCGGMFCISPGFCEEIAESCAKYELPYFPGCITPSEIIRAMQFGIRTVKFFPAESFGGIKTIKALVAPFSELKFIPTGGINAGNLADYLAVKQILACGGSWMVTDADVRQRDLQSIVKKTCQAVEIAAGSAVTCGRNE